MSEVKYIDPKGVEVKREVLKSGDYIILNGVKMKISKVTNSEELNKAPEVIPP